MDVIELFKKFIGTKTQTPDDGGLLDYITEYLPGFSAIRVDVEDVKIFLYIKNSLKGTTYVLLGMWMLFLLEIIGIQILMKL